MPFAMLPLPYRGGESLAMDQIIYNYQIIKIIINQI